MSCNSFLSTSPQQKEDGSVYTELCKAAEKLLEMLELRRKLEVAEILDSNRKLGVAEMLDLKRELEVAEILVQFGSAPRVHREMERGGASSDESNSRCLSRSTRKGKRVCRRSQEPQTPSPQPEPRSLKKPKDKHTRPISQEASLSREWCRNLKALPIEDVPDFCPPPAAFNGKLLPDDFPHLTKETAGPAADVSAQDDAHRGKLSAYEQHFVDQMGSKMNREEYLECKKRIFACYRWRTLEDQRSMNIESAQNVCRKDVKLIGPLVRWYFSMGMLKHGNLEYQEIVDDRPGGIGRLAKRTR